MDWKIILLELIARISLNFDNNACDGPSAC